MNVGDKVTATVRKITAEITVTQRVELSDIVKADMPGVVCFIIAEGRAKRLDWCKGAYVFENGSLAWTN